MKKAFVKLFCVIFCVAFCVSCMITPSFAVSTASYYCGSGNVRYIESINYDVEGYVRYIPAQSDNNQLALYALRMHVFTHDDNSVILSSLKWEAYSYPTYSQHFIESPYESDLMGPSQAKIFESPIINRIFPIPSGSYNGSVEMFMGIGAAFYSAPYNGWNASYYGENSWSSLFAY